MLVMTLKILKTLFNNGMVLKKTKSQTNNIVTSTGKELNVAKANGFVYNLISTQKNKVKVAKIKFFVTNPKTNKYIIKGHKYMSTIT